MPAHTPKWCKPAKCRPINQAQRVPGIRYPSILLYGTNNYAERWPGAGRKEDGHRHVGTVTQLF